MGILMYVFMVLIFNKRKDRMMNAIKQIFLILVFLSFSEAFSEEKAISESKEKSTTEPPAEATDQTEAGAVCLDQNCVTAPPAISSLKNIVDEQLCQSMKQNPECEGIDEDELKGCQEDISKLSEGKKILVGGIEKTLQCGIGLGKGVAEVAISLYDLVAGLFSSDEDPGLKAYLHAEFETHSQNNDGIDAAVMTAGSIVDLTAEALSDSYSCLNSTAVFKKNCQIFSTIVTIATPLSVTMTVIPTSLIAGTVGLTGSVASASILTGYLQAINEDSPKLNLAVGFFALSAASITAGTSTTILALAPVAGAGVLLMHDSKVRTRIKEKIKARVQEFEEQNLPEKSKK